jgi:hypothetical protein
MLPEDGWWHIGHLSENFHNGISLQKILRGEDREKDARKKMMTNFNVTSVLVSGGTCSHSYWPASPMSF